jgi:hypothetical protein
LAVKFKTKIEPPLLRSNILRAKRTYGLTIRVSVLFQGLVTLKPSIIAYELDDLIGSDANTIGTGEEEHEDCRTSPQAWG